MQQRDKKVFNEGEHKSRLKRRREWKSIKTQINSKLLDKQGKLIKNF